MKYPSQVEANIHEISGNFDKEKLSQSNSFYSLHTDSASKPRTFNSKIFRDLIHIKSAQTNGIPQLWYDKNWAGDFFTFVDRIIGSNNPPEVLEIHPPFINYPIFENCRISIRKFDYCKAFKIFLDVFDVFNKKFIEKYKETKVFIENRGSNWSGRFLLTKPSEILNFARILNKKNSSLNIVIDYPQIFSALYISKNIKKKKALQEKGILIDDEILEEVILFNKDLIENRSIIGGIHIWGKKKDDAGIWRSHAGDLNDLFNKDNDLKKKFLDSIFSTFNDNKARYFVPEVNNREKFKSIVNDMKQAGFTFYD
jgi:hypothetical protein